MRMNATEIKGSDWLSRNREIVFSQIDNETVMMDVSMEHYFGLGSVASLIWNRLATEVQCDDLITELVQMAQGSVTPEKCRQDTLAFLADLKANGLLMVREAT